MENKELIEKMTIEEKIKLITGAGIAQTNAIEEHDIPSLYMTDGPNGVRVWYTTDEATCYPCSAALASTWNECLAETVGEYLGDECLQKNVDILLAPGINLKRVPVCGRNFEYYSEDPYFSAVIGGAFVRGVQSVGVGTCLKHYAGYNSENNSIFGKNSQIDEKTLHELYLYAFERIIKNERPWAVMAAYNRLNGEFCCENQGLLKGILREQWGYEGTVISDWGAVHDRIKAIKSGCDLEMPNPADNRIPQVKVALDNGELKESELDSCVERVLDLISKVRFVPKVRKNYTKEQRNLMAKRVAEESITLLKNEEILPLKSSEQQKILVVGSLAQKPVYQGGGCAYVNNDSCKGALTLLQREFFNAEVEYAKGYDASSVFLDGNLLNEVVEKSKVCDKVIFFIGDAENTERETFDRTGISVASNMLQVLDYALQNNNNVIVVIQAGSVVDMRLFKSRAKAIIMQWFSGEAGSEALVEILAGKVNPSGKLSETFPEKLSDIPWAEEVVGHRQEIEYKEGERIGYRYFENKEIHPSYVFGYGLSYTEFQYTHLKIYAENDELFLKFTLKNTGQYDGAEVCQVYCKRGIKKIDTCKKLVGFSKIFLKKGEEKEVIIKILYTDLAEYDPTIKCKNIIADTYRFDIGSSYEDIRLQKSIEIG